MLIKFVICGPEHSGTTLVSDLFRQIPGVDAGFEVGVLLADTPRDFPGLAPFAEITRWSWGVDEATLASCCDTDDFRVFYTRLAENSSVLKPETTVIFDKTPRYLAHLPACMARLDVPFLVIFKDPRAIVYSDFLKSGAAEFAPWFEAYAPDKVGYMRTLYANYRLVRQTADERTCLIRLEDLCLDTRRTCERIYAFLGYSFNPGYMVLRNTRYENTRLGAVSAGIPFQYRVHLGAADQANIAAAFAEFDEWFYE